MSANKLPPIKFSDNFAQNIETFFESSMRRMKLTRSQIDEQDLDQLKRSVGIVEDALARAESFGVCRIKVSTTVSVIVNAASVAHFEVGIVPLLIEAKGRINGASTGARRRFAGDRT